MTDFDRARRAREPIAAAGPLAAMDDAGIAKLAENGVEKLLRNVVGCSDVVRSRRDARFEAGEMGEGLENAWLVILVDL